MPTMRCYEHTFIARQDLSPQQAQSLAETYAALVAEHGGEVTKSEYWGLRNLAYRMRKNRKGHYLHLNLKADAATIDELERQERLSDDVLRYLTVKVDQLEEGPSVAVTEKMRRKMGSTVVDAARAVQYTNAGTFEFLLDEKGSFYFLEVNTRVQVEHPVTEFITGVDIVKEQIRIAAGERLSFKQGDVTFTGHAIECRINAEDPETFAPSPGVIHAFSVPGGPGVRVDTFAHSECTIPPYYDSLIAKIIAHGRDRQEAIARMRRTLEMTVIEGIQTSIPMHLKILSDPDFVAGRLNTAFMERFLNEKKKSDGRLAEAV